MGGHLGFSKFLFAINHLGTWVYLPWKFHSSVTGGSGVITAKFCCKNNKNKKKLTKVRVIPTEVV